MSQRLTTVPVLAAVLFLLTAISLVVKPETGLREPNKPLSSSSELSLYSSDLSLSSISKNKSEAIRQMPRQTKMASAVLYIEKRQKAAPQSQPEPTPQIQEQEKEDAISVASITITRPTPQSDSTPNNTPPASLEAQIRHYADLYGADPEIMISIAHCESGFRADAVNGPYGGMYQFLASTWKSNRRAMGLSDDPSLRFDHEESIKTAAFKMGRDGYGAWPACARKAMAMAQ